MLTKVIECSIIRCFHTIYIQFVRRQPLCRICFTHSEQYKVDFQVSTFLKVTVCLRDMLEETKKINLSKSSDHVIVVNPEDSKVPDVHNSVIVVERSPSLEETNVEISHRCFGCGKSAVSTDLDEEIIEVLNGIYHKVCFKCRHCKRLLSLDQFQVEDGLPCCAPQCDVIATSHTKSWTPSSEPMESIDSAQPGKEQVSLELEAN
ncbi:hypothetical protein PHET_02767 [Paragonimus heterotremus]|uniref:LIM zinc-binding domain-containing protein n=1 Tax=Paragonimus heterotremus TaxID=100268 RepID=A0A8J4WJN7_9TREM|nr:hypothetical protein PHET_02767 [Paragonimus heterotremus]